MKTMKFNVEQRLVNLNDNLLISLSNGNVRPAVSTKQRA